MNQNANQSKSLIKKKMLLKHLENNDKTNFIKLIKIILSFFYIFELIIQILSKGITVDRKQQLLKLIAIIHFIIFPRKAKKRKEEKFYLKK